MIRYLAVLPIISVLWACPSQGATLFLSDKGPGEGPVLANPTVTLTEAGFASLYVWASLSADETINGLGVDILADAPGVVQATAHVVENPSFGMFGDRWQGVNSGTLGELVTGVNLVAATSVGLSGAAGGTDPTYDASGFYLVSRINVSAENIGTTEVFLHTNSATISFESGGSTINFGAGDAAVDPRTSGVASSLADATVTVVPEPCTLWLLLGACLLRRRKRGVM